MVNTSDQTTAKVHKFTREFAEEMVKMIEKTGADFKMSEIIFFDIAMYRLKQQFKNVDWKNENSVHYFIENLLNDAFEIQKKHVKVKIRNLPPK